MNVDSELLAVNCCSRVGGPLVASAQAIRAAVASIRPQAAVIASRTHREPSAVPLTVAARGDLGEAELALGDVTWEVL